MSIEDEDFKARMAEFVAERMTRLTEQDGVPPGSETDFRAYFRLCFYAAADIKDGDDIEARRTMFDACQKAFGLIRNFPQLSKNCFLVEIHNQALSYIKNRLRSKPFLEHGDPLDLIAIGAVGERLGYWSDGVQLPYIQEDDVDLFPANVAILR